MKGIPENITTRQDALNSFEAVKASGTDADKLGFVRRLKELKLMKTKRVLKEGAVPHYDPDDPEHERPIYDDDDWEDVPDPRSQFALSGLTEAEINKMIAALGGSK